VIYFTAGGSWEIKHFRENNIILFKLYYLRRWLSSKWTMDDDIDAINCNDLYVFEVPIPDVTTEGRMSPILHHGPPWRLHAFHS